jgi:hypothetical protein
MVRKASLLWAATLPALASWGSAAVAVEAYTGIHPAMTSGLYLWGGAFFSNSDNRVRLLSPDGSGTELDPGDLGFDESETKPFYGLRWRFTDRWRFEGNYFSIDDSSRFQASEQIDWGELDFEVGANIKAKTETSITRFALGYSFIKSDRVELGAGVGIHYLDWEVKLSGNATVDGEPVLSASDKASVDGWAPNLALFGGYAFNERWMLQGRVDWISAEVGGIDGRLWRFGGSVVYQPFKHVGFGAGYDYLDTDIEEKSDGEKTKIDGDLYGPTLFVALSFF